MPISIDLDDLEKNPFFMELFEHYKKHREECDMKEGGVTFLRRQLKNRFGHLPSWVETRLEESTLKELETWSLQILDANSLEEVFKK